MDTFNTRGISIKQNNFVPFENIDTECYIVIIFIEPLGILILVAETTNKAFTALKKASYIKWVRYPTHFLLSILVYSEILSLMKMEECYGYKN
jgi:hypothetical protein